MKDGNLILKQPMWGKFYVLILGPIKRKSTNFASNQYILEFYSENESVEKDEKRIKQEMADVLRLLIHHMNRQNHSLGK